MNSPTCSNPIRAALALLVGASLWACRCQAQPKTSSKAKPFTSQGVKPPKASSPRRNAPEYLWSLPADTSYSGFTILGEEYTDGSIYAFWKQGDTQTHYTSFDKWGRVVSQGIDTSTEGHEVIVSDESKSGQQAYLAQLPNNAKSFVRLQIKGKYRSLTSLPRLDWDAIQYLVFSRDGKILYVLGSAKLWVVEAKSGRLLRVVSPPKGRNRWGDGLNAVVLSPDGQYILAVTSQLTLYSTRTGQVVRRFANRVHERNGSWADVDFSQDSQYVAVSGYASPPGKTGGVPDSDAKGGLINHGVWVYPVQGGPLRWYRPFSNEITLAEATSGRYYAESIKTADPHTNALVLRRWSDGQVVSKPGVRLDPDNDEGNPHLLFTRDGRWIYFIRKKNLYRIPMPKG